jgi:DNA-binding protein HU-beta
MTKADVIARLIKKTGLSRREAVIAVESVLAQIKAGLQRGERVSLVGFGTFYVKEQRPRRGRNPRTGESIQIVAKKVTAFKPGKAFRDIVNGGSPLAMPGADDLADDGTDD